MTPVLIYSQWIYAAMIIFDACFWFPRFSLLAFYYELFPVSEPVLRFWMYAAAVYTALGFTVAICVDLLWCGFDVSKTW